MERLQIDLVDLSFTLSRAKTVLIVSADVFVVTESADVPSPALVGNAIEGTRLTTFENVGSRVRVFFRWRIGSDKRFFLICFSLYSFSRAFAAPTTSRHYPLFSLPASSAPGATFAKSDFKVSIRSCLRDGLWVFCR